MTAPCESATSPECSGRLGLLCTKLCCVCVVSSFTVHALAASSPRDDVAASGGSSPGCAAGAALSGCMRVIHAHQSVGPGRTQIKCGAVDAAWPNKSRGVVHGYKGWSYCHLQGVAFCKAGLYLTPHNVSSNPPFVC